MGARVLEQMIFRSDEVPREDRFERWRSLVMQLHAPLDLTSTHHRDFRAWQRMLWLDRVTVWPTTFQPARFRRTTRLISASDPEFIHLSLPLTGPLEARRGDLETVHPPGTFFICNTSLPFDVWGGRKGHSHYGIGLEIPRSALPVPRNGLERVTTWPLSARSGYGALLAQALVQIVDDTDSYDASDGSRLAWFVTELVAALFSHALGDRSAQSPEGRRAVLLLRTKTFIQQNLGDAELRPQTVADALNISRSLLYRLFGEDGTSVGAWIRAQRLDRARRDLQDPVLSATPVAGIARRSGFRDASEFSRVFRREFGVTPREFRAAALESPIIGPYRRIAAPDDGPDTDAAASPGPDRPS